MLKEHFINQFDNFICGWYVDKNVCNEMIEYHKSCTFKKPGTFGEERSVNKKIKDSIDCRIDDEILRNKFYKELQKCVDLYIQKYPWCNIGSPWKTIEISNLQYYPPGGGYHAWHSERHSITEPNIYRHLVFITYLNDVNDAGETEFFHQKLKIKPETGLTIIFPAEWPFVHRGVVSPTEEKYIYTGWFNYYTEDK
jgi:hypothetical protein